MNFRAAPAERWTVSPEAEVMNFEYCSLKAPVLLLTSKDRMALTPSQKPLSIKPMS